MVHLNRFIQIPLAEQMSTQMPSGIGMKAEAEKYKDPYYAISIQEKKKKPFSLTRSLTCSEH